MYLTLDIGALVFVVVWFIIGVRVLRDMSVLRDPLVAFHRTHSRLIPVLTLLVILLWPFARVIRYLLNKFIQWQRDHP
jgi:hypothetical protein